MKLKSLIAATLMLAGSGAARAEVAEITIA